MSTSYVPVEDIQVNRELYDTVNNEIIPGTGVSSSQFWSATARLIREYGPINEALLKKRDQIQAQIDEYHLRNQYKEHDPVAYASFLSQIGYIVPEGPDFKVDTNNVDDEISCIPGPQLVVPVDNSRYALNAANARWGSLLDAFYGTDAGPDSTQYPPGKPGEYNPKRGNKVFELSHEFLDKYFTLSNNTSYNDVTRFSVVNNELSCSVGNRSVRLENEDKFIGYTGTTNNPTSILLKNNGLHVILKIDSNSRIGRTHKAGLKDIIIESAVTTIADCEDSVSAVDASDKSTVYRNWAGLMKGTLSTSFNKNGRTITRRLNRDLLFTSKNGNNNITLPGRSLLLVRNVGIHMYTDAILTKNNQCTPEGLMDLMITTLAALHDIKIKNGNNGLSNSRHNSMYIVKPKMHGPEEVSFVIKTFSFVENIFNLPENTLKMGIMDEERRTTVNLFECIRQAKYRCIFINTGFLDRTGDEIHTSFYAGPVLTKKEIKQALWRVAYEKYNVKVGLKTGLSNNGQIGKGMWAAPSAMADMLATKSNHPKSGATCAWVPSPTAGTLHALHYHETNVLKLQKEMLLEQSGIDDGISKLKTDILVPPILKIRSNVSKNTISQELENNVQGILGYVVRWIEFGIGCSTVPDINDIGLMEDRATLRISSQHIANWLYHGIVTRNDVLNVFKNMSKIVDRQNSNNKESGRYKQMYNNFNCNAFQCALELVMEGKESKNGLTEAILTKYRQKEKIDSSRNQRSRL